MPIPYDRLVFVSESGSRRSNIFVKAEIKLPSGFTDPNLNNNIRVKMLGLSSRFVTDSHEVDACTGATGDKGDRVFDFTQAIYPSSWVGQSKLDLHDCPDLKCDRNPIPGVGERGIRWVEHPSTAHKFATVHWFCEGLANERQGSHSYFRFTVKTEFIFLFLVP